MSNAPRKLTLEESRGLLAELLQRLHERGIDPDVYLVGSVAIAIHLGHKSLTPDIDGWFADYDEVRAEAEQIATERGLAPDWVNSNAVPFIEFDRHNDVNAITIQLGGRPVMVASQEALLAMKFAASRVKDREDLTRLIHAVGVKTPEQLVNIARRFYDEDSVVLPADDAELLLMAGEALARAEATAQQRLTTAQSPQRQQPRKPSGTPAGGQFSTHNRGPADLEL
ncbi:hypothetical protein ACWGJ9_09515 [Curtobacterium citreum]